jgi:hypothetical protein
LSVIVLVSYYNTYYLQEKFTNNNHNKTYILLGDSILKNDAYVSNGKSVCNLLKDDGKNIYCYAQDNSKIVDIYSQMNKIPIEFNSPNTLIFLSAGGNNILSHYFDQNQDITNTSVLKPFFSSYKNVLKSIQSRFTKAKIVLLDIYYPRNLTYNRFHSIIKEWNNMIYNYAANPKNHIYKIIRISSHLTQNEDFSFSIEPSSNGGKKIADLILSTY